MKFVRQFVYQGDTVKVLSYRDKQAWFVFQRKGYRDATYDTPHPCLELLENCWKRQESPPNVPNSPGGDVPTMPPLSADEVQELLRPVSVYCLPGEDVVAEVPVQEHLRRS
jgi:hypothetical protein